MTATFQQPDYTAQSGTAYPLAIDAAIAVLAGTAATFAAHASAPPAMAVEVDAGRFYDGETLFEVAPQTLAIAAADPVNPRIDRVAYDMATRALVVDTGIPAANPAVPPSPAAFLPLCRVTVAAGATAITGADLTDERAVASLMGGGMVVGNLNVVGDAAVNGNRVLTTADAGPAAPAGFTRYGSFYMVDDVPAVNAPALNVDSFLAKNTWVSVGPSASGAAYTWTALDVVPPTARLVELRGLAYLNTLATTIDTATLQARKTGTATNSPWLFRQQVISDGTTRAYDNTEIHFKVQCDANRRFDLLWDGENFGGTATIILYLVGWYE